MKSSQEIVDGMEVQPESEASTDPTSISYANGQVQLIRGTTTVEPTSYYRHRMSIASTRGEEVDQVDLSATFGYGFLVEMRQRVEALASTASGETKSKSVYFCPSGHVMESFPDVPWNNDLCDLCNDSNERSRGDLPMREWTMRRECKECEECEFNYYMCQTCSEILPRRLDQVLGVPGTSDFIADVEMALTGAKPRDLQRLSLPSRIASLLQQDLKAEELQNLQKLVFQLAIHAKIPFASPEMPSQQDTSHEGWFWSVGVHYLLELARVREEKEDFKLAEAMLWEIMEMERSVWGKADIMRRLGILKNKQGDFQAAEVALQECLTLQSDKFASIAAAFYELGKVKYHQGEFQAAEGKLQRALHLTRSLVSKEPAYLQAPSSVNYTWPGMLLGNVLIEMARVKQRQGELRAADVFLQEVLAIEPFHGMGFDQLPLPPRPSKDFVIRLLMDVKGRQGDAQAVESLFLEWVQAPGDCDRLQTLFVEHVLPALATPLSLLPAVCQAKIYIAITYRPCTSAFVLLNIGLMMVVGVAFWMNMCFHLLGFGCAAIWVALVVAKVFDWRAQRLNAKMLKVALAKMRFT